MKFKIKNAVVVSASLVGLIAVFLLLTGYGLLVWERLVSPGQHYDLKDYGDLGELGSSSLVCTYFTGRGVVTTVFWHSSDDILGRDTCPFLFEIR
jgi:hypothetical protein